MKRKLLLSILAVVATAFMPLAATSQFFHHLHRHRQQADAPPAAAPAAAPAAEKPATFQKYEIFAGYGYTSLNMVDQSRYGLQGVNLAVTRDWGRYFGVTADGAYYAWALMPGSIPNPGTPTVTAVMFGPVVHAHLAGHVDGFLRGLLGGEHVGGENATPNISFAGGAGGGLDYKLSPRFTLRLSGDDIASSFAANTNQSACSSGGCSSHKSRSSRASIGFVYKF